MYIYIYMYILCVHAYYIYIYIYKYNYIPKFIDPWAVEIITELSPETQLLGVSDPVRPTSDPECHRNATHPRIRSSPLTNGDGIWQISIFYGKIMQNLR